MDAITANSLGRETDILDFLRLARGGHVSGQVICEALKISRTAVWHHIRHLRRLGYDIQASTRRGYYLHSSPNAPLPTEVLPLLRTGSLGRDLLYLPRVDSTNRYLAALAEQGRAEGCTVIADLQSGGRGRLGRSWFSPPGVNLYLSVLLRPSLPPQRAPSFSLAVGAALHRALHRVVPEVKVAVKWPNDLFIGGRKLAGILCDMKSEADRVHYLVVGIGVNVNGMRRQLPPSLRARAVSLREAARHPVSRPALAAALLQELAAVYPEWCRHGLKPFLPELERHSLLQGREVTVDLHREPVHGRVVGISSHGGLLLESHGRRREILSGDVHVRVPHAAAGAGA